MLFVFKVDCLDTDGHGNLIASVEQSDRKLKSSIKRIKTHQQHQQQVTSSASSTTDTAGAGVAVASSTSTSTTTTTTSAGPTTTTDTNSFEISFVPELETTCKIDIELVDSLENILYGDSIKIEPKALDFQVVPFPLLPFHINVKGTFNGNSTKTPYIKD